MSTTPTKTSSAPASPQTASQERFQEVMAAMDLVIATLGRVGPSTPTALALATGLDTKTLSDALSFLRLEHLVLHELVSIGEAKDLQYDTIYSLPAKAAEAALTLKDNGADAAALDAEFLDADDGCPDCGQVGAGPGWCGTCAATASSTRRATGVGV